MIGFLAVFNKEKAPVSYDFGTTARKAVDSDGLTIFVFEEKRKIRIVRDRDITIGIEGSVFLSDNALIDSYRQGIEPFFDGIRGWFNLFAIDEKHKRYFFAHDHVGIKPLYWYEDERQSIVSSSLSLFFDILPQTPEINQSALVEFLIFNHPLGANTFVKDVHLLDPGHYLELREGKLTTHRYFDPDSLFVERPINGKKALEMINDSFIDTVARIMPENGKTGLSLTGGFDGRTVLSVVKNTRNLVLYTFGTPYSSDMTVASEVARQMGLPHRQFIIDREYHETRFPQLSKDLILNSEGLATYERTHYTMAFKDIGQEVDVVLSGNCGSEMFRAIHLTGCVVSTLMGKLLRSEDFRPEYSRFIDTLTDNIPFINLPSDIKDRLMENFERTTWQPLKDYNLSKRFYLLHLLDSFRKFFGSETKADSHYAENHSAYLDIDFLRTLNRTGFSSAYQKVFTENPILRRKGQVTYAYILKKNIPMLADIMTGRGYTPAAILSPVGVFTIVWPYVRKYFRELENTFDPINNAQRFFETHLPQCETTFFDFKKITQNIDSGAWKSQVRETAKMTSWGFWYNHVTQK